ncbi:MAG: AMP-binding protein [Verrucomicrobia bacterium]|nr:AMP-binding protein [Verrucomicrobiota bacterium]
MCRKILIWLFESFFRLMLRFRYRIEVRGKEVLKDPKLAGKGVLVFPNHTAEIEPFMVMLSVGAAFDLRPIVLEKFYFYPLASFFMKLVRAKAVPEFEMAVNQYKLKNADKLFQEIVDDLKKGDHILMYPSSGLKNTPNELVGGRSLAYQTIQNAPDTEIVLVRVTGLWGSLFSKAYTQETPDFWKVFLRGVWIVLKNGLFFTPRRKVVIEFSLADENFPKHGSKIEFNKALEKFYNQYPTVDGGRLEKEPLQQVPYFFWSKSVPEALIRRKRNPLYQEFSVPKSVRQDILFQLSELSGRPVNEISEEADLIYDLGLDSLNIVSLYVYLDTNYRLEQGLEPGDLATVQDLFAAAMHMKKGERKEELHKKEAKSSWPDGSKKRPPPQYGDGQSIPEAFLNTANMFKNLSACTDPRTGLMDYKSLKRAIVILAQKIQKMEGKYIAVMLPSTIGVYIIILAIQLAGKVPVPLNWTIGSFFMNHAIRLLGISTVISSEKFLQKLDHVDLGDAYDKLVLIEDLRKTLTLKDKIRGALLAKRSTKAILNAFHPQGFKEDDIAIILFTSGTTALPKAVPLTHKNIMANQKSAFENFEMHQSDVILVVLPPFHVFGLHVGLLGLLLGVRAVYSPDPLDGGEIAREILKWQITINAMAPTFFSNLFRSASLSQLKSLRVCVSGAEKAPQSLVNFINKLGDVHFLEGYGLTETSPVIAMNQPHEKGRGVGKILSCVELIVIDPTGGTKLSVHQIGEICVRGPCTFAGYYKQDNKDVFVEVEGKKYYRTGDLGYFDEDNYLFLQGRLKLSFKRGGEMINVVAVETALFIEAKKKGWVKEDVNRSPFACVPKEVPNQSTKLVLFSEIDIPLDRVNAALLDVGFSRLYKVNEVIVMPEIPYLKSGKVAYSKLFEAVNK